MGHHYDFEYDYGYTAPAFDSMIAGIVLVFVIIAFLWMIFSLISYILKGIGMYTIAKRQGKDYAWLAFIPFARTYLHGELSGSIRLKNRTIQNPGIWLLALPFIYGAVYSVMYVVVWFLGFGTLMQFSDSYYYGYGPDIGTGTVLGAVILMLVFALVSLVYTALYKTFSILVNHQILECFTSKNMSIIHAVLCSIVPLYESICLFVMRNKPFNPGMGPAAPPPFMQTPPPGPYYNGPAQNSPYGYHQNGSPVPPPYDPRETTSWDASEIPMPQGAENQGNASAGATEGWRNASSGAAEGWGNASSGTAGSWENPSASSGGNPWQPVENRENSFSGFTDSPEREADIQHPESSNVREESPADVDSILERASETGSILNQPSEADSILEQPSETDSILNQPSETDSILGQPSETGSILEQPSGMGSIWDQSSDAEQPSDKNTDLF